MREEMPQALVWAVEEGGGGREGNSVVLRLPKQRVCQQRMHDLFMCAANG